MFRATGRTLLLAALLTWSRSADALGEVSIYDNAQSVPVGGRAAGMGGAYTALACDEGALHYNPASLSCAAASHLELTANAYVLQGLRATGALGPGGNISATTFHAVPTIVGAVRILEEGKDRTYFDTYPERLTFGFTVSVPRTVALEVEPPRPGDRNYLSSSVREDLTVGDVGLGYQLNKEVSVGIALGGVLRTSSRHASWLLARDTPTACGTGACNDFRTFSDDRSSLAVGAHVKLGALVRPYKNLSFGLSLTAPTVHVYGFARQSATLTSADGNGYAATLLRARGSSEAAMPARVVLGFAYVKRRYTFSADASINFARDVRLSYDMTAQAIAGQGTPPAVPNVTLSPGVQPNVNLGASVPFGSTKEINIGFFTDLSSVSDADAKRFGSSRVHMFGGSMTLGLLGKQSRAWIGLAGEIGHDTAKVPGRDFTYQGVANLPPGQLPSESEATVVRWTMTGILGSNYSFLE